MSEHHQSWKQRRFLRTGGFIILSLLLLARIGYGQSGQHVSDCALCNEQNQKGKSQEEVQKENGQSDTAILQGSIHIFPTQLPPGESSGKIQPGTKIRIVVTVENKGKKRSPSGEIYVRYALSSPLEKEHGSVIFETKKKSLPPLEAGQKIDIAFDEPHHLPSVHDYVRHDWSMREYQAITVIHNKEHLIGTLAITFSAHYYPGIKEEYPTKI